MFTRYEYLKGDAKCRIWGGLGGQGSLMITSNVTIRQSAYEFLFDFNRHYASIL